MILFGVNFNFYFYLLIKEFRAAFGMEEVRWYFILYAAATILITINLTCVNGSFGYQLHHSAFQVASVMTTTGFATVDFDLWPNFSRAIMVIMMFIGACAGSTGGGMKVSRYILYFKALRKELKLMTHPRGVKVITSDGKRVDHDTIRNTNMYLIAYIFIFAVSFLLICLDRFDLTTNFTAIVATFNNIGPGLSAVGPTGNFAGFTNFSKIVLIFDMLAGRLEIFPMLILFAPGTWKK
jgi:trk system potassium uptake protein TrkH